MRPRVVVCAPKIPFIRGGTEALVDGLLGSLRTKDLEVDAIELPFRSWPHEAVARSAAMWRMLDLDRSETGNPIELLIATKFPSYYAYHANKVIWLVHQFRQVYDWYESDLPGYNRPRPDDYQLLRWVVEQDRTAFMEARAVYTISAVVQKRLRQYLNVDARVLYPPPPLGNRYYCKANEPEILIVQRLDPVKRTNLLLKALGKVKGSFQVQLVGKGPELDALRDLARDLGMSSKVNFHEYVNETELLELYSRCRMVLYAPMDEDYGFVPIEAFASSKPVITTSDSGGPLEFVRDRQNGWIAEPKAAAIAAGIQYLLDNPVTATDWGRTGEEGIRDLSWNHVTDVLLQHLEQRA